MFERVPKHQLQGQGPCVPWLWDSKSTMTGKCFFKERIILVIDALQAQNTATQNRQRIELSLWLLAWCQGGTGQDSVTELQYKQNQKGMISVLSSRGGGGGPSLTATHRSTICQELRGSRAVAGVA